MKNRLVLLFAMFALVSMVALGADVSGKWMSEATGKGGPQTFTLKQSGSSLTGSVEGGRGGAVDISNGKVDGDNVSFEVTRDMGDKGKFTTKYALTVSGSTMKGTGDNGRGPRDITLTKQ
ncbi:MAG TPA: hypothetical protein VNX18_01040 [Bryobacteraceae bacterium]|nr:hypothetical protein [Bryobacteraceae bacterium]